MTAVAPTDTFSIGGDLPVHRLGYGAMQLPGPGVWGEPADPENAHRVVRAAVEQGVDFIDTADSYGPVVSERIIAEALHPYPEGLVIATKAGLTRQGPGIWTPVGRPAYLKQQVELSLRTLRLERIDLIQLHRIDADVPLADQLGAFKELQDEGKVRHIGVSEVSVAELEQAREIVDVVSVQNLYNLTNRQSQDVLDHATEHGIGFIPWFPIATGDLAAPGRRHRPGAGRHTVPGGAGLAAAHVTGRPADPRHEVRRAPEREPGCGAAAPLRRGHGPPGRARVVVQRCPGSRRPPAGSRRERASGGGQAVPFQRQRRSVPGRTRRRSGRSSARRAGRTWYGTTARRVEAAVRGVGRATAGRGSTSSTGPSSSSRSPNPSERMSRRVAVGAPTTRQERPAGTSASEKPASTRSPEQSRKWAPATSTTTVP
jgi:pyridoxine 4-dehydrogenase